MKKLIVPILTILCFINSLALATDNTLTSYYPSASGNYDKLKSKSFEFNSINDIPKLNSDWGNDCSPLSPTVGRAGRIVVNASGGLVACKVAGTGSGGGGGDNTTEVYWMKTSNGDLIPNVASSRFGFKPDTTPTFIGFKRDSATGDLVAVTVSSANVETPVFSFGLGNNGVAVHNGRTLALQTNTLSSTGSSENKRFILDTGHIGFVGLGASSTGLELHGGTTAADGPPSLFVGSAGNVGINLGGAAPTHNLDVKGTVAVLPGDATTNAIILNQNGTIQMVGANASTTTTLSVTLPTGAATGALTTTGGMIATTGDIKATAGNIEAENGTVKGFIVVKSSAGGCPGSCEDGTMWLE